MKKQTDKPKVLRHSVQDLFSTLGDHFENGKLATADQDWLEKELGEMEEKLKAYKRSKVAAAT